MRDQTIWPPAIFIPEFPMPIPASPLVTTYIERIDILIFLETLVLQLRNIIFASLLGLVTLVGNIGFYIRNTVLLAQYDPINTNTLTMFDYALQLSEEHKTWINDISLTFRYTALQEYHENITNPKYTVTELGYFAAYLKFAMFALWLPLCLHNFDHDRPFSIAPGTRVLFLNSIILTVNYCIVLPLIAYFYPRGYCYSDISYIFIKIYAVTSIAWLFIGFPTILLFLAYRQKVRLIVENSWLPLPSLLSLDDKIDEDYITDTRSLRAPQWKINIQKYKHKHEKQKILFQNKLKENMQ